METRNNYYIYMSLRRDFALSLILELQNVLFCLICSVAFDLLFSHDHLLTKLNIYA